MKSHSQFIAQKFSEWCSEEHVRAGAIPVSIREIRAAFGKWITETADEAPAPTMARLGKLCAERFPRFDRPPGEGQRYLLSRRLQE